MFPPRSGHIVKSAALSGLLVLLMLLTGCGDPEPIKIGIIGEFSGRRSEIGVVARNAAQLLVDEVNAEGGIKGRPVALQFGDSQGNPARCLELFETMTAANTRFFFGPFLSQMAEATVKGIDGKDALVVSPTMSTDFLSNRDDSIIRTASTTSQQAKRISRFVAENGTRAVAVIYDLSNRKYTELLYQSFAKDAVSRGIKVVTALTIPKTRHPEMLPIARELVATGADTVFMCLAAVDAANLSQQIRKLGSDMTLVGASWAQSDDLILHGGRAVEGMFLVATRDYSTPTEAYLGFNKRYTDRYKTAPSFVGGRAYDGMNLLLEGMRRSENITPAEVKSAILKMGSYQGLSNVVTIDEFGDARGAYNMVTVKDGKYVPAD